MATVTQLLDRGSQITGLQNTGTERELARLSLEDVYRNVVSETEVRERTISHTFSTTSDEYLLEDLGFSTLPLKIKSITYSGSAPGSYRLKHVSEDELLEYKRGFSRSSYSRLYTMKGSDTIMFWPNPQAGESVTVRFIPDTAVLSETIDVVASPFIWGVSLWGVGVWGSGLTDPGIESTPRAVPTQFHWNVLLPGLVVQMLDKDQRLDEAATWQQRYEVGLSKMKLWLDTFGGQPTDIFVDSGVKFSTFPDQRPFR